MKNLKILPLINTLLILILIAITGFKMANESKVELVYVDNARLFNEFNMTKEIMSIGEKKIIRQKKELDSLFGLYTIIEDKESQNALVLQSKINSGNEIFQNLQDEFNTKVPNQVWSRINIYIKEYGKQKGFKFIFGISGNGNIMYADETHLEITDEIITYINNQYEGKSLSL